MVDVENPWIPWATRIPGADFYPAGHRLVEPVTMIVHHYTGGEDAKPAINWLRRDDKHYVSAHFVVAKDGSVTQLVSLADRAWHAGGSSSKWGGRGNVNGRSIGIEWVNAGPLSFDGSDYRTSTGRLHRGNVFTAADGTVWDRYTRAQQNAFNRLIPDIEQAVGAPLGLTQIGHSNCDPKRKIDPGPAFAELQPLPLIRQ